MTYIRNLEIWLKENVEYEDYCIENNLSDAARIQKQCWLSVLEKIHEMRSEI